MTFQTTSTLGEKLLCGTVFMLGRKLPELTSPSSKVGVPHLAPSHLLEILKHAEILHCLCESLTHRDKSNLSPWAMVSATQANLVLENTWAKPAACREVAEVHCNFFVHV